VNSRPPARPRFVRSGARRAPLAELTGQVLEQAGRVHRMLAIAVPNRPMMSGNARKVTRENRRLASPIP
jgi:hypothetical protein